MPTVVLAVQDTATVGVLAFRPKPELMARWQPTIDYLAEKTGRSFSLAVLDYDELETAIRERQVDFVLTNPSHYVLMTKRNGLSSPLATLIEIDQGQPMTQFGGVIFTQAGRTDIATLHDLAGQVIATPDTGSFGGYQMQAYELARAGVSALARDNLLVTGMPHDKVVYAVMEGRAEVGFVRTGVLEALIDAGKLERSQIRVLAREGAVGFPFMLSTYLYPEWPFAAMPDTEQALAQSVAKALFSLSPSHPAVVAGRYHGWAVPVDYEPVRAVLQALRLPPYDDVPAFTWQDVFDRYGQSLVVAAVSGMVIVILLFMLAVRERQLRGQEHRLAEERQQLLGALGEGVYGVDGDGRCTFINPAALGMLRYTADELLGQDQHRLIHHHYPDGRDYESADCPIALTLRDGKTRRGEEHFFRKDGSGFPVGMTTAPILRADSRIGAVVVFHDISERKQLEAELQSLATTDPLTGLSNRRQFLAMLEQEAARLGRFEGAQAALLMLDLDHFKHVNDSHGHAAGDAVLRVFADQVRASLRKTDLAGRLGGEEFAILLVGSDHAGAMEFAERLREQVAGMGVATDGVTLHVTVSIGVTTLGAAEAGVDAAMARADKALYLAKENGRNRVEGKLA